MQMEPATKHDTDDRVEHDAWLRSEIEATLAKKASGEMTYSSLDQVMHKFGFDAD